MKKNLFFLGAVAVGGLIFFPDETRGIAWKTVNAVGDLAADTTANAIVGVEDRVDSRRNNRLADQQADEAPSGVTTSTEWQAKDRACESGNCTRPSGETGSGFARSRAYSYIVRPQIACGGPF